MSPLTNHKSTKKGIIIGGFDRVNLFQQAEQGFDKLFRYDRQLSESFEYANTMKNGSIYEQLKLQGQEVKFDERILEVDQYSNQQSLISIDFEKDKICSSLNSFISSETSFSSQHNEHIPKPNKKKKKKSLSL